jgi:hypothetical protein
MSENKIVVLDGTREGDEYMASPSSILTDILDDEHADVTRYQLKDIKVAHCTGCFGCWTKTPGMCVISDESGEIIRAIIRSDMTIFFTPVTFGGYSSVLKRVVDRIIPLVLPFFGTYFGEIHHTPRYARYPRLVGIGVQHRYAKREVELFKMLVGRNALNFHAPSFAADVFSSDEDDETLKHRMKAVMSRSDPFPGKDDITAFFPTPDVTSSDHEQDGAGHVLLLVGSPKIEHRSTSSIAGEHMLDILKAQGWKTETLTLKASLNREKGQVELCAAVDRADVLILAFPLYIDSLPYLVTKALEVIANYKQSVETTRSQRMFVFVNSGFPEWHQNTLAVAICRRFADQCGILWAGALALGAGEALGGGQELRQPKRSGPPVTHVVEALDLAGADLAAGRAVSPHAQSLISKTPIPMLSFGIWRWMFPKLGGRFWKQQALEHGVKKEELTATPYAD